MKSLIRSLGPLLVLAGLVAGCALPRGAAIESEVVGRSRDHTADFAVFPVTRATLATVGLWPVDRGGQGAGWIGAGGGGGDSPIQPGDRLDLSIWDSSDNSLLAVPGQRVVALQGVTVSSAGTVFLPYIEEVRIAGMTPDAARGTIQTQLAAIVPNAQVQLTRAAGPRNSVDLVKGVGAPGTYPLDDRGTTVLNLIARAGGVEAALRNPQVRLMRGGQLYGIALADLLADPRLDTALRGGDKLYVEEDDRYFLSLGAAGQERQVPFPTEQVTALDAASLIGGVQDNRGNPRGVLILRDYSRLMKPSEVVTGPGKERVVFTLDLTTADGLFSAGQFRIQPRDLVLVTESPITGTQTILQLVGSALGLAQRADNF